MESLLVGLFCFTSIVADIAYLVELHRRNKRDELLEELSKMNSTQFNEWKRNIKNENKDTRNKTGR